VWTDYSTANRSFDGKKETHPLRLVWRKISHLDWLLPLLPHCHHYCEPFAGSGAVLLNRDPSPVETFNDLDGEVVNFFRVLREEKERLIEAIGLTPFAREEFALACEISPDLSALERARRFYVRARQVRTGLAQTATVGRWANCKNTSRAGMSGVISRWLGAVEDLPAVAGAASSRANRKSSSRECHPPLRFAIHAILLRSALCPLDAWRLESLRV